MKRHALITIAFAALFGFRAPLCVFACLESGQAAEVAVAEVPAGEQAPCHGTTPEPSKVPESGDHDCTCDRTQLVVSKSDVEKGYGPNVSLAPPLLIASFVVPDVDRNPSGTWSRHEHLPPPDILLLNSTLLL